MKRAEFMEKMSGIDPKYVSEAANYKPKRANYIKVIAIAACIATLLTTAAVWGLTLQTEKKSTFEILSSVITSEDEAFTLARFDQKEIFVDLSTDNLSYIMAAFDLVIARNEVVELADHAMIYSLLDYNEVVYQVSDEKITVKTGEDGNILKYAMFASVYIENFADSVFYLNDDRLCINAVFPHDIMITFDYGKYGYDDAYEYITSEAEIGDNVFCLSSVDVDMYHLKSDSLENPAPNLLDCINSGDSIRIQRYKGTYIPKVDFSEEDLKQHEDKE